MHPLPECQAWSQFAGAGDWVSQDRCHRGGGGGRTYTTSFTTGTGSAKHNEMVSLPVQWTDGQMDSLMSPARSVAAEEMLCDASCCTSLHAVDFHSFFLSIFPYSSWCLFIIIAILFTNLLNLLFNITSSCVVHLTYSSRYIKYKGRATNTAEGRAPRCWVVPDTPSSVCGNTSAANQPHNEDLLSLVPGHDWALGALK